jgi:hypothetical protein
MINVDSRILLEFIEIQKYTFFVHRYDINNIQPQTIQSVIVKSPFIVDMLGETLMDFPITEYKKNENDKWTFNNAPTTLNGYTFHGWKCDN